MKNSLELNYKQLKDICNPNMFQFETTADIKKYNTIYGQDRGINALQFGVQVEVKGYNIFVEFVSIHFANSVLFVLKMDQKIDQ